MWAATAALHDVMLLYKVREKYTLQVGVVSAAMLGVAVAAMFFWAAGATQVFLAKPEGHTTFEECACFYKLPEFAALMALATPMMLLSVFATKVMFTGMAAMWGDHLYYKLFPVPHYLAKQSYLWTWATLVTPKLAGTVQANPREHFEKHNWAWLFAFQLRLYYFR